MASFHDDSTFDLGQFEDYYDELFGGNSADNLNTIDGPQVEGNREAFTVATIQTKKLKLLHKKLVLSNALTSLRHLITKSQVEEEGGRPPSRGTPQERLVPATTSYTPLLEHSSRLSFPSSSTATSSFLDQLDLDRRSITVTLLLLCQFLTCRLPHVTCHMSPVTCHTHLSPVTCPQVLAGHVVGLQLAREEEAAQKALLAPIRPLGLTLGTIDSRDYSCLVLLE